MPREDSRRLAFSGLAVALVVGVSGAAWSGGRDSRSTPTIALESVASGLGPITSISHAGDGRLFLTNQDGRVLAFHDGAHPPAVFLDLTALISCCGERGLLSTAFHPRYAENGLFFVDYTSVGGDLVVARYHVSAGDPDAADPLSGVVLLSIPHPSSGHNGGQLQFGPDGYLYVSTGDGGFVDDSPCNAQRVDTLLGKLLRIDVDRNSDAPPFYGIPPTNPFVSVSGAREEIWARGLRNPWRFSFDRSTGDLHIGDVGQTLREEIDFQQAGSPAGANFGWKLMEGSLCGGGGNTACPAGAPDCGAAELVAPVFEYSHIQGNCAVTGGGLRLSRNARRGARRTLHLRRLLLGADLGGPRPLEALRARAHDFRRGRHG